MVTPYDEQVLGELQARWPDFDITREWWGFLCVPRGTYPVVTAVFPDGVDAQLMRLGVEPAAGTAANVVELAGQRAGPPTDDGA